MKCRVRIEAKILTPIGLKPRLQAKVIPILSRCRADARSDDAAVYADNLAATSGRSLHEYAVRE
jgi:hypothetical protein